MTAHPLSALPDDATRARIAALHACPQQLVFEFTGAGSLALFWLHSVGGSSRTVLEATDRYATGSLTGLLGSAPARFVAPETARAMAERAYLRARRLAGSSGDRCPPVLGVGVTATIATDRTKRGDHRVCVAVQDAMRMVTRSLPLTKGARDRFGEETVVAHLCLGAVAEACGIEPCMLPLLPEETVETVHEAAPDPVGQLLDGLAGTVLVRTDGTREPEATVRGALLCGSFNPVHAGHRQLASVAERVLGMPVRFELAVWNADKPPLTREELERRISQFGGLGDLLLSRAPLFHEKAALYPGCVFIIGHDTAARVLDSRYYGSDVARDRVFETLRRQGCRFLVAGRLHRGAFQTLDPDTAPESARDLLQCLPESEFRVDLSSTELRRSTTP